MRAALLAVALVAGAAGTAEAFCGFYVGGAGREMFADATQVVLMRHGTTTVLSMSNDYQGPPEAFALVIPVPVVLAEAQVKTLPRALFDKVDVLGAPRLVEYWEQDPCPVPGLSQDYLQNIPTGRTFEAVLGAAPGAQGDSYGVTVEAEFTVEEYEIVILSAKESTGLDRWLRDHDYKIPAAAEPLLRPYIESGSKFFVAKVDPAKVTFDAAGRATLSPLRFHYDSDDFALPIRLGLASSSGTQDLIVNVLGRSRYEVANYPNTAIPTNIGVHDTVRARFGEFYAALFDHTLAQVPGAVVTEYAWDSSSCDPCPGPTLSPEDLMTLGGDVLARTYTDVHPGAGMVLTRLHARYGREIDDDLVFRAVDGLTGGTGMPDTAGRMNPQVFVGGGNMFQGRYIIRHPWQGPVECEQPVRGVWGGPPSAEMAAPVAATDVAYAPRGQVALSTLVADDIPSIGVTASEGLRLPDPPRKGYGCGCGAGAGGSSALALLALGLLGRRRRQGAASTR